MQVQFKKYIPTDLPVDHFFTKFFNIKKNNNNRKEALTCSMIHPLGLEHTRHHFGMDSGSTVNDLKQKKCIISEMTIMRL